MSLFNVFYTPSFNSGWMSFSKRPGRNTPQCYTKPLDSLKNWSNHFFWVDERVFLTIMDWRTNAPKDGMPAAGTYSLEAVRVLDTHHMDLFNLIRASNPTKVKVGSHPRAPHEVPLLTLTAPRVIEMDEPAATDSSGVLSTIERSSLDFANEAGASDQGAAAPEIPSFEDVPATIASGVGQAEEAATMDPLTALESRSSRRGKSLASIQLGLASSVVLEDVPVGVSDPDPMSFADAPSRHPADVAQSSQGIAAVGDPGSENVSSPAKTEAGMKKAAEDKSAVLIKELEDLHAQFSDLQVGNEHLSQQVATLQEQVSGEEKLKAMFEEFKRYEDERVEQRCTELDARLDALGIDFDEELYPHMLTAIACHGWVIGHGLSLAMMKCAEYLEMRQAFADVVSAGVAKGMSEGLKHGVEHGHAQLKVESIKAYDPEAEAKFVVVLQSLKDLKYPLLDQLEGLKDAPMDVRDPRNPWAYKEEMKLSDAIATNITHTEKKKKCHIVCRTHGVGSAYHARSDGVLVSTPTVVPQGLALLLVDAATQTDLEDLVFNVFYAPWESWLFPNVLGIALRTRSPRPLGLQPAYAANHVQRYMAPGYS
uniref:Transposase (Putative), gypsy type n=1 Tax=Tanacetum cinerariifolium TaxID=118510 RepID=A0A6L2K2U3_TANCI|nr:transposase (putative), gypsy type [Tanacetum cinerariifolium]